MQTYSDHHLAVLIDADNVSPKNVKGMLEEIAKYGTPTFKRIYGDWTKPQLTSWKSVLLENAITPIQQYSYTSGKNSTDSAMIIDAMDILYSDKVRGFCIVSSDSDFTRLATRLREAGMRVFGMGERKTPTPFIGACDKFIYLDILNDDSDVDAEKEAGKPVQKTRSESTKMTKEFIKFLCASVEDVADEDGWSGLGEVGTLLVKKRADFDPRNYGFSRLTLLCKSLDKYLEIEERTKGNSNTKHVYVRTFRMANKT
jgi:uncharacterized LabA/DUF88 family protein